MPLIFDTVLTDDITLPVFALCVVTALLCGGIIALAAHKSGGITKSMFVATVLLPPIVTAVILMVNGNIGTGIAVAGAFSLVRFRSAAGKARDIVTVFLSMAAGLCCAAGYLLLGLCFTALLAVLMIVLQKIPLGTEDMLQLSLTVPETLNYTESFEDIFNIYTKSCKLTDEKTTNMGSLFKLKYQIVMKNNNDVKPMIDALRCRNGNLEIAVCHLLERNEEL